MIDVNILWIATLALSGFTLLTIIMLWVKVAGLEKSGQSTEHLVKQQEAHARLEATLREELRVTREEAGRAGKDLRSELGESVTRLGKTLFDQTGELSRQQKEQLELFSANLRRSAADSVEQTRVQHEALLNSFKDIREQLAVQLKNLSEANTKATEALKQGVENQMSGLRKENTEKLEQMRATVDEKLQGTLEKRLGESFKVVSERLEAVHQGLGEMQSLATGVGDLKRVLTNVKARGSWGEVQLGALLEQVLTSSQIAQNASVSDLGGERVEFAIRLPGNDESDEVYLPIDAKFPIEDYERLQAAAELGDLEAVEAASKALEVRIKSSAKDISSKYINPPKTTDFAIMFLPTEGLYAEVIRRPGLCDELQRTHRIVVAGPTTLTALLNSLQMGFRTLAIQQRSSEVWQVLGEVKTEFGKFGPVLEKVKKKLQEASNHIDNVDVRSRAINRKLRDVEAVADNGSFDLLETVEDALIDELEEEGAS